MISLSRDGSSLSPVKRTEAKALSVTVDSRLVAQIAQRVTEFVFHIPIVVDNQIVSAA